MILIIIIVIIIINIYHQPSITNADFSNNVWPPPSLLQNRTLIRIDHISCRMYMLGVDTTRLHEYSCAPPPP